MINICFDQLHITFINVQNTVTFLDIAKLTSIKECKILESLVNYQHFKVYAQIQFSQLPPFWIDVFSERATAIHDFRRNS